MSSDAYRMLEQRINPFRELGIDARLLSTLSYEQGQDILKAHYRALQSIFHPDKQTGDADRARNINEAYSVVSECEEEIYWSFVKRFGKKTEKAAPQRVQSQLDTATRTLEALADNVTRYLLEQALYDPLRTHNPLSPCTLNMVDSMWQMRMTRDGAMALIDDAHQHKVKVRDYEDAQRNYDLVVPATGPLRVRRGASESNHPSKRLIGTLPWKLSNDQKTPIERLILNMLGVRSAHPPLSDARRISYYEDKTVTDSNGRISPASAVPLLCALRPLVEPKSYLFSLNSDSQGHTYFYLDGFITDVKK